MSVDVKTKLNFLPAITITSGGTRQSISPGVDIKTSSFQIVYDKANVGTVYVGDNTVTADKCIPLSDANSVFGGTSDEDELEDEIREDFNLKDIYIDGTTGDKVYVVYTSIVAWS